jgi:hypothetical protein
MGAVITINKEKPYLGIRLKPEEGARPELYDGVVLWG